MTLNNANSTYRGQANVTVDDPCRFNLSMWLDPLIQKFVPKGHFGKPLWDNRRMAMKDGWCQRWELAPLTVSDCPNVIGYDRNDEFNASRWLFEDTINWGNSKERGGGRSVMLAGLRILFLLGFRRVYLLGVDFEMSSQKRYHFQELRSGHAICNNLSTYAKLQRWFEELQPHFLREGFVVKNCNPASKLTAFPFIQYEEAVAEATAHLGDYSRERTVGMYQKMEAKLNPKVEQAIQSSACNVTEAAADRRILDPLLVAVAKAKSFTEPFWHIRIGAIFPSILFEQILANLPADRHYQDGGAVLANGQAVPREFSLDAENIRRLPEKQRELWRRVRLAFASPHLEKALRRRFDQGLANRFGANRGRIRLVQRQLLLRNTPHGGLIDYRPAVIAIQINLTSGSSSRSGVASPESAGRPALGHPSAAPHPPTNTAVAGVPDAVHSRQMSQLSGSAQIRDALVVTYDIPA
ncbi:MAG TPA: hypothetical protein VH088_23910 [Terriglobales bacterium]|nr:hypothetical protein [Terriglobales bacterium]